MRPEALGTSATPAAPEVQGLIGRQVGLLVANPLYVYFLALLPAVLAALTLLIPGDAGLDRPGPSSHNPHEAIEILAALNISAVIIGTALGIRDLAGERRALGLSTSAYLAGKAIVVSLTAAILTAALVTIVMRGKGGPVHGGLLLDDARLELYAAVAATAIVSALVGLALSTLGKSARGALLLALPVILASVLLNGSLVPLVTNRGLQQISWLVPAQWGFAASASTVDLRRVDALAGNTAMWTHYSGWWVFDMVMLIGFGAIAAGFAGYRLGKSKREIRSRASHLEQQNQRILEISIPKR